MQLLPMVYKIKRNTDDTFYLEPYQEKFELPERIYGDVQKFTYRVWNSYVLDKASTGVILSGYSGAGKSMQAELLCNLALENHLPVIYIRDIKTSIDIISFLGSIRQRAVMFFDEYSKNFSYELQSKMLTLFSDTNQNKLFILTENDLGTINNFIRSRPGRFKYHRDYKRIAQSTVNEYCDTYNVGKKFYDELIELYKTSTIFTFDHMQALVTEHLRYPEESINELLSVLNLGVLTKTYKLKPISLVINDKPLFVDYAKSSPLAYDAFINGARAMVIYTQTPPGDEDKNEPGMQNSSPELGFFGGPNKGYDRAMFSNENIIDIRDDIYITCKNEQGFIAVFEKTND
jgi:hypothetical protein